MRSVFSWFCMIIFLFATALSFAGLSGSLDERQIIERIKPIGEVSIEGASAAKETVTASADIGQSRYEQTCKMCHETGLAGAPKLGDKTAWKKRLDQGMETVINHAIHGLKAMPPKGGCSTCSDEEIKKAIEYMLSHSK